MLRQDDFLRSQLVLAGWRHGHVFGGHLASCMVMCCLASRVRLGWGTWMEILNDLPSKSATIEQPLEVPSVWEPQFVRLLHEVDAIFDGSQDYAKGALYWFDSSKPVTNPWFQDKILGDMNTHKKVADMNSLMLLR